MANLLGIGVRRVALEDGGGVTELAPLPADGREVRRALLVLMAGAAAQSVTHVPEMQWNL